MQSKKRFTEINIWEAPFFTDLTSKQKLLWFYINDRCNNIGLWTPNLKLTAYSLDIDGDPKQFNDDFIRSVNKYSDNVTVLDTGEWLINGFVKFQYVKGNSLNPRNPAHKSYLRLMKDNGLVEWFYEHYPETLPEAFMDGQKLDLSENSKRPLDHPFETYKDKDKEKAKDMDRESDMAQGQENEFDKEQFKHFSP